MSTLNIYDLYKERNEKKDKQNDTFDKVLLKCHTFIKNASKFHYSCYYVVPEVIVGLPLYSIPECIRYLLKNLKSNGFVVNYIYPKTIYISWDPKKVNTKEIEDKNTNDDLNNYDQFLLQNKPPSKGKFTLNIDD